MEFSYEKMKNGPLGFVFDFFDWFFSSDILFIILSSTIAIVAVFLFVIVLYFLVLIIAKPVMGMKMAEINDWLKEQLRDSVVNSPVTESFISVLSSISTTAGEVLSSVGELTRLFFGSLSTVILWPTRLFNNWVGGVSEKIEQKSHEQNMITLAKRQKRIMERAQKTREFQEQKALLKHLKKGVPLLTHETKQEGEGLVSEVNPNSTDNT